MLVHQRVRENRPFFFCGNGIEYGKNGDIMEYHGSRNEWSCCFYTCRWGFETLNSLKHPIWDLKYRGISLMNGGTSSPHHQMWDETNSYDTKNCICKASRDSHVCWPLGVKWMSNRVPPCATCMQICLKWAFDGCLRNSSSAGVIHRKTVIATSNCKLMLIKCSITLWWTNIAIENGYYLVDFPMKNGDFPLQTVSSPEGITSWWVRWKEPMSITVEVCEAAGRSLPATPSSISVDMRTALGRLEAGKGFGKPGILSPWKRWTRLIMFDHV